MKTIHYLPLFIIPVLALGCIKNERIGEPQTVPVASDKTYAHEASKFEFPLEVAGQKRGKVTRYNVAGTDISVAYDSKQPPIAFTVYVYPVPKKAPKDVLGWHFNYCKSEVVRNNSGAKLLSETPITLKQGGVEQQGMRAYYSFTRIFGGKNQPCLSELDLFVYEGQFILYRMTFAQSEKAESQSLVERFFKEFTWPFATVKGKS